MKKKTYKIIAVFLAINILTELAFPTAAYALTGGPSQPEVKGFTPVGTSDMVNVFTGDFNYNIPLMDVGGYPLNLSYQSGISMDQEASWVGLGWSLNPGVIDRSMRSLPDDFDGDLIKKEFNVKPNTTYGIKFFPEGEVLGINVTKLAKLDFGLGLTYNNYTGYGFSMSIDLKTQSGDANKGGMTGHLGLSAGSESGVGISPSLSFSKNTEEKKGRDTKVTAKIGLPYNSRAGLQALTISTSVDKTAKSGTIHRANSSMGSFDSGKDEGGKTTVANGGSAISFATPTYSPSGGHSMLNTNLSVSITLGGELFGGHPEGRLEGFFSGQFLLHNYEELPAYGYMNSQNGTDIDKVLLDFNREKDGSFTEHTPALPLTNFTYDVYSVSGQGIGGMYRPHRSDIGVVYDSKSTNVSAGIDFPGIELGAGNTAHPGVNFSLNQSDSRTGKWEEDNTAEDVLGFKKTGANEFYEPYYFKQAGEKAAESDIAFFDNMGGFDPVRINLNKATDDVTAMASYNKAGTNMTGNVRTKRDRRNEVVSLLRADEASLFGEIKVIEDYGINDFDIATTGTYKNRYAPAGTSTRSDSDLRKAHHTSQITTYRSDGAKYVYGIPAYNIIQEDKTFAIEGGSPNATTGLVGYSHSAHDDLLGNQKGVDHYFDKTTMPGYAHSYLLTEVLSTDYVDVTGNGPSDDDLGTYTKINYSKIDNEGNYKWRVPYEKDKANYSEGFRSVDGDDKGDDKASYIYGEKELWYVHSIETKNFVAEFTTSERRDAYGVKDDQGGWDATESAASRKLVKITLYSKRDKIKEANSTSGYTATPIKTVHFEYDYSLCKGVGNNPRNVSGATSTDWDDDEVLAAGYDNDGGKLTLKRIYFTYGNSAKGKLSPYEFTYADLNHDGTEDANPTYNLKGYDRWGNYKPNSGSGMTTSEFPYVDQDGTADARSGSWEMTSVNLPSGGVLNVDYESDDYAYVQNKRAMQMFKVRGASYDVPVAVTDATEELYMNATPLPTAYKSKNYLIFDLQNQSVSSKEELGKLYFNEKDGSQMEFLYFKFLVDLGRGLGADQKEFIPGYCRILDYNIFTDGGVKYGWVKIKEEPIGDLVARPPDANPISQAAWNYTKLYLPRLAYGKPDPTDPGVVQILEAMVGTVKSIVTVFNGFFNQMRLDGMAKGFDADKSFIRLYNPINSKEGGGSRVSKIRLSDSWKTMTGGGSSPYENFDYGQEYNYTTLDEYGATISSGVAAYEPMLGGDENPFRMPVFFEEKHLLAASDDFFQEKPYGESFFPGPGVGYSKVTVKNLVRTDGAEPPAVAVARTATGKTVHEFYTAKDFPTITKQTSIDPSRKRPNPLLKLLKIKCRDYMTASQGFVVELNDMHGKPKAQWTFQEGKDKAISGVEYLYKASQQPVSIPSVDQPITVGSLDNTMLAMEKDGSIAPRMVGVDYDFITDMREQKTTNRTGGLGGNLDAFLVAVLPITIPIVLPSYSQEKVRFRSVSTTKVINRYGLLEETIVHDLGAAVSTKNKLLDAETGEVLLTETKNQYDDPIYAFNYPAHWSYDRMGPAYKNIGMVASASVSVPAAYFVKGDEVYLIGGTDNLEKGWVKSVSPLKVVDIDGNLLSLSGAYVKVIRSGRRNQQNTSVGQFTSLYSPLIDVGTDGIPDKLEPKTGTGILNATSVEFAEDWGIFCECGIDPGDMYNPYIRGKLGIWRPVKSYVHLTGRSQSNMNANTYVRKDGTYTSFSPFWAPNPIVTSPAGDWPKDASAWQFASQVTIFSPYGMELENQDALNRYSSAVFGYNNSLPTGVAANARYKEIAFDSFEDYDFNECTDNHFGYKLAVSGGSPTGTIDETKSHTGKRSIKIASGQTVQVTKVLEPCPKK